MGERKNPTAVQSSHSVPPKGETEILLGSSQTRGVGSLKERDLRRTLWSAFPPPTPYHIT